MAFCLSCGKPIDESARYCRHCGTAQEAVAAVPRPMYKRRWAIVIYIFIAFFLTRAVYQLATSDVVGPTVAPYKEFSNVPWSHDYNRTSNILRGVLQADSDQVRYWVRNKGWVDLGNYSIVTEECGQANAFYHPSARKVVMCEELAYDIAASFYPALYREYGGDQSKIADEMFYAVRDTLLFIRQHEAGHAWIAIRGAPITGREEDVADQFAFARHYMVEVLFNVSKEDRNSVSINAAKWYFFNHNSNLNSEQIPYYDEHGLDMQRFYNIMCWVYGTDPISYSYFVDEGYLPIERAKRCPYESYQLRRAFLYLYWGDYDDLRRYGPFRRLEGLDEFLK